MVSIKRVLEAELKVLLIVLWLVTPSEILASCNIFGPDQLQSVIKIGAQSIIDVRTKPPEGQLVGRSYPHNVGLNTLMQRGTYRWRNQTPTQRMEEALRMGIPQEICEAYATASRFEEARAYLNLYLQSYLKAGNDLKEVIRIKDGEDITYVYTTERPSKSLEELVMERTELLGKRQAIQKELAPILDELGELSIELSILRKRLWEDHRQIPRYSKHDTFFWYERVRGMNLDIRSAWGGKTVRQRIAYGLENGLSPKEADQFATAETLGQAREVVAQSMRRLESELSHPRQLFVAEPQDAESKTARLTDQIDQMGIGDTLTREGQVASRIDRLQEQRKKLEDQLLDLVNHPLQIPY